MSDTGREQGLPHPEPAPGADATPPRRELPAAARRALAEAAERRAAAERQAAAEKPREFDGPKGLEPTRFGDWERKGIVSDF